jgi:RNA polymerase subunit RPABC4/transcription elongation factor Spt4
MGLGPLICVECEIFAREHDQQDYYVCPRCGSQVLEYLWMYTEAEQARIADNDKFYRFVRGD